MQDHMQDKESEIDPHKDHAGMDHSMHQMEEHTMNDAHQGHTMPASQENKHEEHSGHAGHGTDHTGHEQMFRTRFWWCLLLSIPVLLYSGMIQMWLGFTPPAFPFSGWIPFVFSVAVFLYGGIPFLQMAVPELQDRKPGMMTLISLAISVAFLYSVAAQFLNLGEGFFWELVTLIDIMLLGHWLEMRSVRQASGALNELAKLMPDTAERIHHGDQTETVPTSALKRGDLVLVRPGASIPADGEVVEGHSNVNESMITGESAPVHKMAPMKVIAGTINGEG
ncbi:MAG TPA: copper-translocating P-type ATPase, partial [Nitrosospira sp.]